MTWQENLISNLIVMFVLLALATIVYCKLTNKTLLDVIREIKEGFKDE